MCTVSWVHSDHGYSLFCNRDEKRSRKTALEPEIQSRNGVWYVSPIDGDFGGSWISVNEFGLSLTLLNRYDAAGGVRNPRVSRGLLLAPLLSADSIVEVMHRMMRTNLHVFAPFTLAAIEPDHPVCVLKWDGTERTLIPDGESLLPLVSSSVDQGGAERIRARLLRPHNGKSAPITPDALSAFHSSHSEASSALSPCMHRADAETVSFSRVDVTGSSIRFTYTPDAPCRRLPSRVLTLTRVNSCTSLQR